MWPLPYRADCQIRSGGLMKLEQFKSSGSGCKVLMVSKIKKVAAANGTAYASSSKCSITDTSNTSISSGSIYW